jgi:hypothetical protein
VGQAVIPVVVTAAASPVVGEMAAEVAAVTPTSSKKDYQDV